MYTEFIENSTFQETYQCCNFYRVRTSTDTDAYTWYFKIWQCCSAGNNASGATLSDMETLIWNDINKGDQYLTTNIDTTPTHHKADWHWSSPHCVLLWLLAVCDLTQIASMAECKRDISFGLSHRIVFLCTGKELPIIPIVSCFILLTTPRSNVPWSIPAPIV